MPHSSRKKPSSSQHHKRLQVTDDSGWTHVTTGANARRLRSHQHRATDSLPRELLLVPAEAPPGVTLESLQHQLHEHRQRWERSLAWTKVEEALARGLDETQSSLEDGIVCIGLGSPSGFLRGGWVDRRTVSMYQLAALASILEWIQTHYQAIQVYAQDPVFNDHDKSLLSSLNITVLDHPLAFEKVSSKCFVFGPGAERNHLSQLLSQNPAFLFGGPLEDIELEEVKQYVEKKESVQLPIFEEQEHAFWGMRLYYPRNVQA